MLHQMLGIIGPDEAPGCGIEHGPFEAMESNMVLGGWVWGPSPFWMAQELENLFVYLYLFAYNFRV